MAKSPKKESGFFKAKELTCKCGCNTTEFDLGFLATLNAIREECGFSFALSSAYRCPQHPIEALEIIRVAQKHGIQRIGIQQKGGGRFIHLDACTEEDGFPNPAIWSY